MAILLKHLFKNIVENKFRSVAIIFIVILSTMVSVIALSLNDIVTATYENVYNASIGDANITIEKEEPFSADLLDLSGVEIEKQENLYDITGKYYVDDLIIRAAIRGIDVDQYVKMGSLSIIDCSDNFSLNKDECIISAKSAEKYGLNVGSSLSFFYNDEEYQFTVKALGENNRTFYEEQGNIQVLIPIEACSAIAGNSGKCTKVRLKTASSASFLSALTAQNPDYNIYEGEEFESLHFQMQSVSGAMLIIMCIVILIGGYIISSLVKIIMTDRMPVIGTFRSIGTDQPKVVAIVLFEFFLYGIIGMTIGVLLGMWALPKVADMFNQYKEYGVKTVVDYNAVYLIAAAVIGLALAPIMALTKVISASKTDIKEIILQTNSVKEVKENRGIVVKCIILGLCLSSYFLNKSDNYILGLLTNVLLIVCATFIVQIIITCISKFMKKMIQKGSSCLVGVTSVRSNRYVRNNSSMLVTICLIFLILITIIDGIRNTAQNDLDSYGFDIISIINDETDIHKEDMEKFEGVEGAFESYEVMAFGNYANGYCRVYGVENFDYLNQYMEALSYSGEGAALDNKLASVENGIVIDQYWARVKNISVGDKIKLYYDDKRKKEAGDFTVVDTWDCSRGTTDRVFVGISLENYKRIFEKNPERILMKTSGEADKIAVQISQKYIDKNITVQTTMDFLQEQINTVNTIIRILIASIIMASVVIVIGISSNMIVAFIRRKKEFATLYSVCMDMKQIKDMILWESIISFISIALTLLLVYVPLVACIPKLTSGLGLVISYHAKLGIVLGVLIVTLAIILVTTIEPIRRLKKMNIVEELKYE